MTWPEHHLLKTQIRNILVYVSPNFIITKEALTANIKKNVIVVVQYMPENF